MQPISSRMKRGFLISILVAAIVTGLHASTVYGDDTDIFSVQSMPNTLLILDDTGSMTSNYGGSVVGDLDGDGTQNTRLDVAYRVLYQILNGDGSMVSISGSNYEYPTQRSHVLPDGTGTSAYLFNQNINNADENALRMRIGLMIYGPTSTWQGFQLLKVPVQTTSSESNLPPYTNSYRSVWDAIKAQYTPSSGNGTPMARAVEASRTYFNVAAVGDSAAACRKRFAILITDGEDTVDSTGSGSATFYTSGHDGELAYFKPDGIPGSHTGQKARNYEGIRQAKLLADNGVTLFVVGVGMLRDGSGMDHPHLRVFRQVLRRMAEQRGIDLTDAEYAQVAQNGDDTALAAGNAFFATNADDLLTALQNAIHAIIIQSHSFASPVVPAVRTTDNNRLYQASFLPDNPPETFWEGRLQSIALLDNGSLTSPPVVYWDSGIQLMSSNRDYLYEPRNVYTSSLSSGTWTRQDFTTSNSWLDYTVLGVPASERDGLITDIVLRTNRTHRMGDIFHSNPVVVGSPNAFYSDAGFSTALCFSGSCNSFYKDHQHRQRVIYAGGNDGMLHAYDAGIWQSLTSSYNDGTGKELFAYIPNILLDDLNKMKVTSTSSHPYFVDGSPTVADVWLDENGDNAVLSSEWKTVLISGMRKGGRGLFALDVTNPPNVSNPTASQVIANNYSKPLWEITDADIPTLGYTWSKPVIGKVRLLDNVATIPVTMTRWVAFVGGGYATSPTLTAGSVANAATIYVTSTEGFPSSGPLVIGTDTAYYNGKTATSFTGIATSGNTSLRLDSPHAVGEAVLSPLGRGFYVIDIRLGKVLWAVEGVSNPAMKYPFPSNPIPVDSNSDGYMDYVYNVDTGGQLWRFDFVAAGNYDSSSQTVISGWSGKRIFAPSSPPAEPFFHGLDVALDYSLNRWIYFGSGDREDPTGTGTGRLYAVQDKNPSSPYDDADLANFTSVLSDTEQSTFATMPKTKNGWFMDMPNSNEKILSTPVVFNDQLFFTTFEPTMNLCGGGGTARLYGLRLNLRAATGTSVAVGAGVLEVTGQTDRQRSLIIQGGGIASNPVISMSQDQGAILYLGTTNSSLQAIKVDAPSAFKKLKSWKEWIAQ
jgi:hypothetical protein